MHRCLFQFGSYLDHDDVTLVDAISDRLGDAEDAMLEERCVELFKNYKNEVIPFIVDENATDPEEKKRIEWGIRSMAMLRNLYRKQGVTVVAVLSIPHHFVDEIFPPMR